MKTKFSEKRGGLMKNIKKIFALISATFLLAACVMDDETEIESTSSKSSSTSSETSSAAVTAVSVSGTSAISYNGTTTLTANTTTSGNPTISYTWSISSGSNYASISGSDENATLTANNTTSSEQSVTVKVTASDGTNSVSGTKTLTIAKNGETVKNELTAVSLASEGEKISASGKAKLTATATYTGSPSITYIWEITDGGDYAYFTSEGEGSTKKTTVGDGDCKITANNTSESEQPVTVKVTASDGTNSFEDSVTITIAEPGVETSVLYIDLTNGKVSADNSAWSEITTSKISFSNDTISVKYTKDSGVSTGLVKIDATDFSGELTVNITGTATTGGVKIQSNGTDAVNVKLNGANITSSNYPCLEVTKGSPANVFLNGTNTFVDGRAYGTGYGEEYSTTSGATYTEDGVTYYCTVVKSAVSEGSDSKGTLYSKGDLTISGSGSLSVTQSYKNCIASKSVLTINGGTFTLKNYTSSSNTGKNGLFGAKGIVVNDGTISFDGKGIISTSDLRKANGFKTDDEDYTSSYVMLKGGIVTVTTYNGKGINAPKVYIAGGTNTFTVTGTTSYSERTSSGTWYDADGVKESGTVKFAPEGIEGESIIEISGGTTIVSAPDDGINVSTTGGNLNISGGFLYVKAQGDGLDSNGNITVSGGTVVVSQTGGGNSPIDCGDGSYSFKVTGTNATIFAMGSSDMFSESIPSSTVSPMIYSTVLGSSSSSLGVNGVIGVKSPQTYAAAILVSNSLTSGTSYDFVKGGTISGTEIEGTGVYFPASVSGTSSVSAKATTQGGSGSSMGGGGFGGGGFNPGR